jgi:AraC family transcriptional regulator
MLAEKVLWAIERNLDRPLTLAEIADACGVSHFHLAHAFGQATGISVMQYVRARRLAEAAESLAAGDAPDILDLALDAGYGSHEAFSRAFSRSVRHDPGSGPQGRNCGEARHDQSHETLRER